MACSGTIRNLFTAVLLFILSISSSLYAQEVIPGLPDNFRDLVAKKHPHAQQIVKDTITDEELSYGNIDASLMTSSNSSSQQSPKDQEKYFDALVHVITGMGKHLNSLTIPDSIDSKTRSQILGILKTLEVYYNAELSKLAKEVKNQNFSAAKLYQFQEGVINFSAATIAISALVKEATPLK